MKKSINWAIWRKSEDENTNRRPSLPPRRPSSRRRRSRKNTLDEDGEEVKRTFNLQEKLIAVGMEEVVPGGRCEGGQIQKGSYNVTHGGMYALVFGTSHELVNADNTFSKNTSKTVFFILSNHPISIPHALSSTDLAAITDDSHATTFSGILYKKRRKKLQGIIPREDLT
jgi:hypothetical protein